MLAISQFLVCWSLSARRAWIEIETPLTDSQTRTVALRKESVDRNTHTLVKICLSNHVALRKESVDRNSTDISMFFWIVVALRKESVDRNPSNPC